MVIQAATTASAVWLWEEYGKALTDKALDKAREAWTKFRWKEAEAKYRTRVRDLHSTTRLFGHPKPIIIEDIFTDVYVLDKLTAWRRYELEELQARPFDRESLRLDERRRPALRLAVTEKRLYLLGKPGAGKTTFLKFLALQACVGKIPRTPIFISLKEWADSGLELMTFLVQQFHVCSFPDAQKFIEQLLEHGNALVLLDGLDEVNQQGNQRHRMINTLTRFATQYPDIQICLTCRIAATDYSFAQFKYLEIADFDDRQIRLFANKWYQEDRTKLKRFLAEFAKPEHEGLRELARTPLLLALLCLAFDETMYFPARLADLYKEALDALLKKWDASRGIERDSVYRRLSPLRKEQLLARLAARNFEGGKYFMRQDALAKQITSHLQQLPAMDIGDTDAPDGDTVLKAIEVQHGILVERAHGIYSFSHLTFQEYLTARSMTDNAAAGAITRLVGKHVTDDRWHEVFLLTASMLDNADAFFETFFNAMSKLIRGDKTCVELLRMAHKKSVASRNAGPETRAIALFVILDFARMHVRTDTYVHMRNLDANRDAAYDTACARSLDLARVVAKERELNLAGALSYAKDFGIDLRLDALETKVSLASAQADHISRYVRASLLLLECLQLAVVSDRAGIRAQLLLPPGSNAQ